MHRTTSLRRQFELVLIGEGWDVKSIGVDSVCICGLELRRGREVKRGGGESCATGGFG
jgi:hypothetical protein